MIEGLAARGLIERVEENEAGVAAQAGLAPEPTPGLRRLPWRLTRAGRRAAGVEVLAAAADGPGASPAASPRSPPRKSSKLGAIVAALGSGQREGRGATLADLCALTGWQAHTVRAALTRLPQRGVAVERVRSIGSDDDAQTRYRLRSSLTGEER